MGKTVTYSRKSQFFPTPCLFNAPVEEVPLEFGIGARGQKTRMMGLPSRGRLLMISSALDTIHEHDGQTDGQIDEVPTDTRRQQRPRLRIASRGNDKTLGQGCQDFSPHGHFAPWTLRPQATIILMAQTKSFVRYLLITVKRSQL